MGLGQWGPDLWLGAVPLSSIPPPSLRTAPDGLTQGVGSAYGRHLANTIELSKTAAIQNGRYTVVVACRQLVGSVALFVAQCDCLPVCLYTCTCYIVGLYKWLCVCTYLNAVCRCHIGVSLSCLKHCEPIKVLANPVVIIAVAALKLKSCAAAQGRSDGGVYRYIYPQNQSTLQIFMWLKLVVFSLTHAGQIRYRASVRLSSCFFYLLTHHNLYPPPKWNSWLRPCCSWLILCMQRARRRRCKLTAYSWSSVVDGRWYWHCKEDACQHLMHVSTMSDSSVISVVVFQFQFQLKFLLCDFPVTIKFQLFFSVSISVTIIIFQFLFQFQF